jgi:hypothetical protein
VSVSDSDGGINPVAGAAAPAPTAPPGLPPGAGFDELDRQFEEHLGQLAEGWPVSRVAQWQRDALALLARYPYPDGCAPQHVVSAYFRRLRDALRSRHYAVESVQGYMRQFRELATPALPGTGGGSVSPAYVAVTGSGPNDPSDPNQWGMFRLDGDRAVPLTNFVLAVDEEVVVADGLESERLLTGRVIVGGVTKPFKVTTAEYASDENLRAAIYAACGVAAQFFSKPGEVRNAVAALSTPASRTVTTDYGWNATHDAYLVPSGTVTVDGFRHAQPADPVRVDLAAEEHVRRLDLRPLDPDELARVRRHLAEDLLRVHDPRVVLVLFSAVALAVVRGRARCVGRFAIWLTGLTGSGKSFLARLFQNFFGHWPTQDSLPGFGSTVNYLERQGYFFRDAIYTIDDYKPNVTPQPQIIRLLQAYADGTGRGRLRSDATANTTRPIRGLLLLTGEDTVEHTPSALARAVVVTVPNRAKDLDRGLRCEAESVNYPGVTADFIRWVIVTNGLDRFARRVDELRVRYYRDAAGDQNDARIAGNFAQLAAAGELMLDYLADVIPDAAELATQFVETHLVAMRDAALADVAEEQESTTFLRILAELITLGRVRIEGFRARVEAADGAPVVGFLRKPAARGDSPAVPEHFELNARACVEQVKLALGREGKTPLKITEKALLRQLRHDGLLLDGSGGPLAVGAGATRVARFGGHQLRFFGISRSVLLGDSTGDPNSGRFGG